MSYVSSTSTDYANVFKHDPDIIGRDITGEVYTYAKWKIFGSTTVGATLTVKATHALGSSTCELTSSGITDIVWSELTELQPIYSESLLEADGLRDGLDYSVKFEIKSSNGDEVRLFGIVMVEESTTEGGSILLEIDPPDMDFSTTYNPTYFDPFPTELQSLDENFSSESGFTFYTEGTLGTHSVASNQMTINGSGTRNTIVTETGVGPSIPQLWAEIQVDSGGSNTSGYDNGGVGIVKDNDNFLFASWDRIANVVRIQIKIGGSNTFLGSVSTTTFSPTYKMALSLVANSACLWRNNGSGWSCLVKQSVSSYYDFRTTGNLTDWKWGFTIATSATSTWVLSNFNAGSFGGVGMRDFVIVTEEDGSPYMVDANTVLFSATANDPNGISYEGVFSLDITDCTIVQKSVIFVERDGKSYNDVAAHIIYYSGGNRRLFISTWGNGFGGSLQILHKLCTTGDILSGVNLIGSMTELSLPGLDTEDYGAYDPMAMWDGEKWLFAYSITEDTSFSGNPFYPALATSSDLSSFDLVGADTAMSGTGYEGTKLIKTNTNYWVLSGGPVSTGNNPRIYNDEMEFVDNLTCELDNAASYPPHPMVFAVGNYFYLLTNDSNTYGGVLATRGYPQLEITDRYYS